MNLQYRVDLMCRLGEYMLSTDMEWQLTREKAGHENSWFIPEFIDLAINNIARTFLVKNELQRWVETYSLKDDNRQVRTVGIVMAGNIPLVGFHDLLAVFMSGHKALIKPSSKDETLIKYLVEKLIEWEPEVGAMIQSAEMLKGCDAYIATGSNNSSRYFEHYFGKYPHIIRRNRTSVAILSGNETMDELSLLADDVYLFFGLGCRNVTKIYVPEGYDFLPLLDSFKKYDFLAGENKYKNNFDYNLTLLILNKKHYMTNGSILLAEDKSLFSPISRLNYEFYNDMNSVTDSLTGNQELQCIVGVDHVPFGRAQCPPIMDFADGIDTLAFLTKL